MHADCALTASDVVGNASAPVTLAPFIVDRTPPTLAEVVPAPATGEDPVRAVVVSTTEAASLVFSSGCPPADVDALAVGETTITFTATLGAGVTACAVTATDAVGNASAPLHLTPFYVNTPGFIENHKKNGMAVIYQDIQATPDGGYLLASEKTLTRLDAQMSPVWSRELSGVSPRALAIGPGGYAIVTGTTSGDLGAGFGDAFLMRVEANGDITWVRTYGLSNTPDDLDGVAIVGQGAIIAVGRTYVHNDGGHQGWVVHADTDGTLIGSQVYGGSGYEQFSAIVPGDGATKRIVGRISTTLDSPDDPLLVEIWLTGDVWEARRYTANWDDDFRAVAAGPNGSIYAVGRTVSFWPPAYDDPVYYNGVVAKIDFSNDLVWERSIGGVATAVTAFGGGVVVGGYAFDYGDDWNEGDFPDYTEGDAQDGILVAFDPDGTALWTRIYETGAKIDINGLVPTADGGVLAVGKERWTGIWDYGVFAKLDAGGNVDDAYCGELRRIPAEHGAIPVTFGATSVSMPVKDLAVTVTTVNPALIQPYLFDLTVTGVCE